ncbi:MAG: MFS transporter [Variovorax sp.]|nr:MFS transporter [Variovorax sp.]
MLDLPNAVALNSTSMNLAQMVGPAAAGIVIAAVGSG